MSPAATLLAWGAPFAVLACALSYAQRRAWRRPPRTPREATLREYWSNAYPYTQLGVRVRPDGYVYSNLRCTELGRLAGARSVIVPSRPVTRMKPPTAWAVIYFADGSCHRQMIRLANLPEARAQSARFNGQARACASGVFRRAWAGPAAP